MTPDLWAHQYDQQVNQVVCGVLEQYPWTSNGPESNVYGLQPNFGCCTANLHQGWPKLVAHLWMRSDDGGLAGLVLGPCTVRTTVQDVAVEIDVETAYPFDGAIRVTVRVSAPVRFPLRLRIPVWAEGARLQIGDAEPEAAVPGTFVIVDREWHGEIRPDARSPAPDPGRAALQRQRGALARAAAAGAPDRRGVAPDRR